MIDTTKNTLAERGRALEDAYFLQVDHDLIRKRHDAIERNEKLAELKRITGVDDDELSKELLEVGIEPTTVAALALTPLVFVAWADGSITSDERQTVISTAMRQGVYGCPDAFKLLEQWLRTRPRKPLWEAWKRYAIEFHNHLPAIVANKLVDRTISRATRVAKASGGVLGFGKISNAEQRILDEIEVLLVKRDESNL